MVSFAKPLKCSIILLNVCFAVSTRLQDFAGLNSIILEFKPWIQTLNLKNWDHRSMLVTNSFFAIVKRWSFYPQAYTCYLYYHLYGLLSLKSQQVNHSIFYLELILAVLYILTICLCAYAIYREAPRLVLAVGSIIYVDFKLKNFDWLDNSFSPISSMPHSFWPA